MKRINLLPKQKQKELSYEKLFYSIAVAVVSAALILIFVVVIQFGVYFYLSSKQKSVNSEIDQLTRQASKTENTTVKQEIKTTNAQIDDFTKLSNLTPQWSSVIAALVRDVPNNVKITQFDADSSTQIINISGYSPTRDLVIDLYNNINTDKKNFKNINYPLGNITSPTNVRFSFTFSVADGVLLKGVN